MKIFARVAANLQLANQSKFLILLSNLGTLALVLNLFKNNGFKGIHCFITFLNNVL